MNEGVIAQRGYYQWEFIIVRYIKEDKVDMDICSITIAGKVVYCYSR